MADNKVKFLRGTSAEYEAKTKDNDTFYYTTDDKKLYLGETEITGSGVTIDNALSDTSKNPVQNKVVKAALDNKADLSDIPTSLPANGGNADTVNGLGADVIPHGYQTLYNDADLCTKSGYYMLNSTALNIPIAAFGLLVVNNGDYADSAATWAIQTFYPTSNGGAYRRMYVNGSFTTWVNIADGGNASTVNGLTVQTAVPAEAKFTDTTYAAASTSAAGLVSTATQHFGGYKTFPMVGLRTTGTVGTQPSSDINTAIYFTNADVNAPFGIIKNCIRSTTFTTGEVFTSLGSYSNYRTGTCELKVVATNNNSGNYVTISNPTVSSSASCLRKLASGTAEATTSNCPSGAWYGQHS